MMLNCLLYVPGVVDASVGIVYFNVLLVALAEFVDRAVQLADGVLLALAHSFVLEVNVGACNNRNVTDSCSA